MKKNNVLELIGNTPVVRINNLFNSNLEVFIKLEKQNPGGSIKDRIALSMINDAEAKGILNRGTVIVEPTSGNTGIGLALVSAIKGYQLILVMPESMSVERRKLMKSYGAKIELTQKELGMKGAIDRASVIQKELNAWMPKQFSNPSNPKVHSETTAQEVLHDFPEGIDFLVTGVGTGGHISGVGHVLKEHWSNLKIYAVEPEASPVISGGQPGPHPIQGIGAGFIPENLDVHLLDKTIQVSKEEAFRFAQLAAQKEGLIVGISTGASLAAISKIQKEGITGRVLTFAYDTGERYLSIDGLF